MLITNLLSKKYLSYYFNEKNEGKSPDFRLFFLNQQIEFPAEIDKLFRKSLC